MNSTPAFSRAARTLASVFVLAVLLTPTLAAAQDVAVNLVSPGTVIAKGAGVDLTVQVACKSPPFLPGPEANGLNVFSGLTERVGDKATSGEGASVSQPITCNGLPQTFETVVTPFNGGRFGPGTALAVVSVSVFTPGFVFAESAQQMQQIKLAK